MAVTLCRLRLTWNINTHWCSSYRAVNTLGLVCKNQSVNVVYRNNRCLFWDPHKTHKYTVWAESRTFRRGHTVKTNAYQLRRVHPPACPSVRKYQRGSHWTEFQKISHWALHTKFSRDIEQKFVTLREHPSVYCWQRRMQRNNRNGTHCCVYVTKVATRKRTRHTITLYAHRLCCWRLNLETYEVAIGLQSVNSTSAATNSTTLHIRQPLTTIDNDESILFYLFSFLEQYR